MMMLLRVVPKGGPKGGPVWMNMRRVHVEPKAAAVPVDFRVAYEQSRFSMVSSAVLTTAMAATTGYCVHTYSIDVGSIPALATIACCARVADATHEYIAARAWYQNAIAVKN